MLGAKLGEETGRVTARRVLEGDDYRYVKMEITFETTGTILGRQGTNIGTYVIFERVPGQIYGEGRGIFMSNDGASAIWNGHGVGHPTGDGMGMAFASSVAFQASEELSQLNGILALVEHRAGNDGSASSVLYEWKAE